MSSDTEFAAIVDSEGRVVLPDSLKARMGIQPGSRLKIEDGPYGLKLHLPQGPAKLYIEPTNQCNLGCRTCIRNTWKEPMGMMDEETFSRIIRGLGETRMVPRVVFGGFGEPLFHPGIVEMVRRVKALGARVELITNGTLLKGKIARGLAASRLDVLWLSLDGATPESYSDIRLGAALPAVLENMAEFSSYLVSGQYPVDYCCELVPRIRTEVGIVFVAMKRNIADLPSVVEIGKRFNATRFMVTNVLPYSKDMVGETLYCQTLVSSGYRELSLPDIDANDVSFAPVWGAVSGFVGSLGGNRTPGFKGRCPFISAGACAIGWDGRFSPCLPLLHSHQAYYGYLTYQKRFSREWALGNVKTSGLIGLWNRPEHQAFRARVDAFDFPPCTSCGSCHLFESNEEDCIGSPFPTCGGCLWAQGVIQCP